jgi:hypothetical protein
MTWNIFERMFEKKKKKEMVQEMADGEKSIQLLIY